MYDETKKYLNSYGASVVNEQKTRLRSYGKGGGNLEKSLNYKIIETQRRIGVDFYAADYAKFVDEGVEGSKTKTTGKGGLKSKFKYRKKMVPTRVLDKWIVRRGLAPKDKKGRFLSRASLKYAIARSIFLNGIERTQFLSLPIQRSEKRFQIGMERALKKDIEANINKALR